MLPIFLNDLQRNNNEDLVEVTLELEDDSIILCNVTPNVNASSGHGVCSQSSVAGRLRRKFPWLTSSSSSSRASFSSVDRAVASRDARKMKAQLIRTRSSAQRALGGLRFISKTTSDDVDELWKKVEFRFVSLARDDGLLAREDFAECIGDSYYLLQTNILQYTSVYIAVCYND